MRNASEASSALASDVGRNGLDFVRWSSVAKLDLLVGGVKSEEL